MAKYKVDESNNKIAIRPEQNFIILPPGQYTKKELKEEIAKRIAGYRECHLFCEWVEEKGSPFSTQGV